MVLKFHEVITSFAFEENIMDNCIYLKVTRSKICFLVLYVDDILLVTNDKGICERHLISLTLRSIEKDLETFLGLFQEIYINKFLDRFNMKNCSLSIAPIIKGDKLNLN
ncbi:hypothetical protein CR513_37959, partial [Mucuna pruriens]